MKVTIEQVAALQPCYSHEYLATLIPNGEAEITLSALLSLPKADARWFCARIFTKPQCILWAQNSAARAKKYAATAAAPYAAAAAADAAAYAVYAAADAAYAEHKLCIEDAINILNQQ